MDSFFKKKHSFVAELNGKIVGSATVFYVSLSTDYEHAKTMQSTAQEQIKNYGLLSAFHMADF